ncbi:ABC transporter permease [Neobacillus kokaensis]|uniref:Transport permease YfiN n=1 Tax=Neobacillus kokaensis TaxID=2759023 RepID=A0ABQ3N3W2_9BACI|nr:ABC transporter permease [Neobacillus kokaensis]GHH99623.1 putative transport permease YfiN [Neobacillus kokaensis]
MRRIFPILSLNFKNFLKTPGAIILMFVMPVVFSWIFGGMSMNSERNKPVVNIVAGSDEISEQISKLLKKDQNFNWEMAALKKARENVLEEKVLAVVVIPKDIEKRITGNLALFDVIIQKKSQDYLALAAYLQGTARLVSNSYQAADSLEAGAFPHFLAAVAKQKGVTVEKQTIENDSANHVEINLMVVGFAIMFMMFGLSGAASTILEERRGGTWSRLLISPARKFEIIIGYLSSYFLMGWIQFAVLLVAMKFMFGADWGKLSYLVPFASLVILMVVGFGLMVAGIVQTKQQAMALNAILIVSTCMLGGVYWPLDIVPEVMQKIALGVPQSWAMSGFKEIMSGSLHTGVLIKDTLALLGFTILFYVIGLRGIKFD